MKKQKDKELRHSRILKSEFIEVVNHLVYIGKEINPEWTE